MKDGGWVGGGSEEPKWNGDGGGEGGAELIFSLFSRPLPSPQHTPKLEAASPPPHPSSGFLTPALRKIGAVKIRNFRARESYAPFCEAY